MYDPKLWLDLATVTWLIFYISIMKTKNMFSAFVLKVIPFALAIGLAMSHAKTIF